MQIMKYCQKGSSGYRDIEGARIELDFNDAQNIRRRLQLLIITSYNVA